jgi:hypothetical protein
MLLRRGGKSSAICLHIGARNLAIASDRFSTGADFFSLLHKGDLSPPNETTQPFLKIC